MGIPSSMTNFCAKRFGQKLKRILMVGLDTALLYQLKLGEVVQTIPTLGF